MADGPGGERTEKATPKKRRGQRKKRKVFSNKGVGPPLSFFIWVFWGKKTPVDRAAFFWFFPAVTPADDTDEEDALPTRRTMNTLKQVSAQRAETEENAQVGISYMLSSKAKVVLAAIALVIVAALAIICVNTGILNTLDAQIAEVQAVNAELQMNEEAVRTAIEEVMSQENIVEWALSQGMQVAP